jgi:alpha-glucosidase/alpha-D-xyloside xylohydrolase
LAIATVLVAIVEASPQAGLEIDIIDPPEKGFFSKRVDFHGIPIKAHAVVADEALYAAYDRLALMFTNLLSRQPMVLSNLVAAGAALHIIGRDQVTTDLPEWRHDKGKPLAEYKGLTRDQRTRGMGGLLTSCGEENLLKLPNDRYRGRDICLHEFAHNVLDNGCPREIEARFEEQRKRSLEKERWQKSYAGSNADEFFAELTMWYFGTRGDLSMTGPKPADGPEGLKAYDPEAFALIDDFYGGRVEIGKVEPRERRRLRQVDVPAHQFSRRAELTISEIGDRTLRIQLSPLDQSGDPRRPTPSTVLVSFPSVERLRTRELETERGVWVGQLRVTIKPQPLTISVRRNDGQLVQELSFEDGTNAAIAFRTEAPVFGLEEGAQQFDRRGALYPMEASWGGWNRAVLGSVVPSPFLIGTEGWALFFHAPEGRIDLREQGRFIPRTNGVLDLFLIDVSKPPDALAEYIRLTGRPAMPPKWALGYFQSHRTLAGPDEPLQIARTFRERNLPCDALIYLGTGYCTNGWNTGHGSVAFNTNAFAPENIKALHVQNFKVVLHVNRAPRNLFGASISETNESRSHIGNYWPRHRETFALDVDGWWPDDGDELPVEARLARHRCYYEGPLQDRPNVRPWSLHRTGYAGAQRYGGWIWSGDTDSKWETLAAHVSIGLNHGLSLTPFWGSDTGGFYPTRELTGELYVRWFQFSAFCPSFRSHGRTWKLRLPWWWNSGEYGPIEHNQNVDRSELKNPYVLPIVRYYLDFRYRLLPYNYTLAREACDTGLPMMRALWLHYPDDAEAVKLGTEYLWGRDLLVAPVFEKGAKSRRLYLPEGVWYDWGSFRKSKGKRWIEPVVELPILPLYARAGAIIPLDPVRQHTAERVSEPTELRIFPGADGLFTLYDDDGHSLGYRDGSDPNLTWIRFRWNDSARRLTVERDERMKQWNRPARTFTIDVIGARQKQIEFRGEWVTVDL